MRYFLRSQEVRLIRASFEAAYKEAGSAARSLANGELDFIRPSSLPNSAPVSGLVDDHELLMHSCQSWPSVAFWPRTPEGPRAAPRRRRRVGTPKRAAGRKADRGKRHLNDRVLETLEETVSRSLSEYGAGLALMVELLVVLVAGPSRRRCAHLIKRMRQNEC